MRFLHLLSPCPPGWRIPSEQAIAYARLAVATRVFPLVEVENGTDWRVNVAPSPQPLENYLRGQGRFRTLVADAVRTARLSAALDERWNALVTRAEASSAVRGLQSLAGQS